MTLDTWTAPVRPARAPEMPKMGKGMAAPPPPLPKFNAQNVQLNQMGGFNALKAANSMGLGAIPQYNPNQAMTPPQMPGQPVMAPPPMPGQPAMSQSTAPPMPQAPTASSAPSAPFASKSVQSPAMPGGQAKDEFFIDDEEDEDEWDEDEQGENELNTTKYGIILTNTDILARKYGCEQAHVMQILSSFVEQAAEQDMEWHLVDMAQLLGSGVEADTADWTEYSNAVSEQIQIDGLPTGSDLHLLIIGGDDVIPVPRVKDPWEHGEGEIPTDMPYCFEGNFIPAFIEGTIADLQAADARNNVANSLMVVCAKLGVNFIACGPRACWPASDVVDACMPIAAANGCEITLTEDPFEAVRGADVVYTDVWVSMGEPDEVWEKRIQLLTPYRVTEELMELTHSRIPVYKGDPDNIVGILHIKDYLYNATKKGFDNVDIKKLLRPAYFVPETKNIDSLFRELQIERQHLAILIDEYGGFSGIVSVEDIIEQIVGDIDDEFDEEDRIIEKVNDTTFIVDGNVYLDDLEEETDVELESETSETVGGFIIDLLGEIPRENVKYKPISYEDYSFTILSVKDRRIVKIRIEKTEREDGSDE